MPILAASTGQATNAFTFVCGIFDASPALRDLVESTTADTLRLKTGVDIRVQPASWRTVRGITSIAAICDEIAFWRADESANPDKEILNALRPSLATTGGPLICISSPYAKRGELYSAFKSHYGPSGDPRILIAKAPSRIMNPSLPQRVVDRAFEQDATSAAAEYGAEFRGDIEVFVSREALEAAVAHGVFVRAPVRGQAYVAFADPSGGSSDSMTVAVAHRENERVTVDCLMERKAPFSPESVVHEFCDVLKSYGVARVVGDRYAGEWPTERFRMHGIAYLPSELNRSELYLNFLPLLNSGRIELIDNPRMVGQFAALERRTSRAGRDTVDHSPGAHDDLANAVAGVASIASAPKGRPTERIFIDFMGR